MAVWTNVQAPSKVALHDTRVVVLLVVDATIITDPVPVPFATRIMATGIKRVPDVDAGIKFSIVVPFLDLSEFLFGTCPSFGTGLWGTETLFATSMATFIIVITPLVTSVYISPRTPPPLACSDFITSLPTGYTIGSSSIRFTPEPTISLFRDARGPIV